MSCAEIISGVFLAEIWPEKITSRDGCVLLMKILDGPNRPSPIASVHRTRPSLRKKGLCSILVPYTQGRKNSININFLVRISRTFLTLTPGRPWVKKFLPITGAAEKRTFWCGRPRFLARTSMTRRVFEKLCTKKFALIFWPLYTSLDSVLSIGIVRDAEMTIKIIFERSSQKGGSARGSKRGSTGDPS